MYKSVHIKNFRCFTDLELNSLDRINLITGDSNVGKTSLLEALFLLCVKYNPRKAIEINALRGFDTMTFETGSWSESPFQTLFRNFNTKDKIVIKGKIKSGATRTVELKELREAKELARTPSTPRDLPKTGRDVLSASDVDKVLSLKYREGKSAGEYFIVVSSSGLDIKPKPPGPPHPAYFIHDRAEISNNEFAERFSQVQLQGKLESVVETLKIIEPRLKDLSLLQYAGKSYLYGNIGLDKMLPLAMMGNGIRRIAFMIVNILLSKDGVALIDEVDDGLHYSVLLKLWEQFCKLAEENNTQLFITTHSLECIRAAHETFSKRKEYGFKLYRLDRVGDRIEHVIYNKEDLESSIDINLEVR